jgi:hypothetical protein
MPGPAYGQTITQDVFLGYMSTAQNWAWFVQNILPDVLTGNTKIIGGDYKTVAGVGEVLAAVNATGQNNYGATVPPSVIQAAQNPQPAAPVATAPTTPGPGADQQQSLQDELNQWGLGDLFNQAWALKTSGQSDAAVVQWIRTTDDYKQRFAGNVMRQAAGLTPLSEADYLKYEDQARQVMRAAGLPAGFYDSPSDFANLIGKDVSPSELNSRVQIGMQLAQQEPPEVQQEAARLGLTLSDQAAGILDPDTALPLLQRKLSEAQIGGASLASGYGQLSNDDLQRLSELGISESQARTGFANIAQLQPLLAHNPGEDVITQQQVLGAQFEGNAADQAALSRRQKLRLAEFSGGGTNVTSKGAVGLGTAQTTAS